MTAPCLIIRDLDVIKQILIKDFDLFEERGIDFSDEGLGTNLFHANGPTWRVLRNKFTPLFTTAKLKNVTHLIIDRGENFVEYLKNITSHQVEQDIYSLCRQYTISTIAACAFGIDIDTVSSTIMDSLNKIDRLIFTRTYLQELDLICPGLLKKLNLSLFPTEIRFFFQSLVSKVMNERKNTVTSRKDFMDLILELKQIETLDTKTKNGEKDLCLKLTQELIAAQAFVFYAAGYETSASTLAYLFYELALNPEVQNKLIDEIDNVIKINGGDITYDTISSMPYMDKVFSETLRKYPVIDLQRQAKEDYKIPETNVTVNKGQIVIVSTFGIHYDEKYYPDPEKFDPERFSPENSATRHICAYLPFGLGPRHCIGLRFASIQSRICVFKLLSKFRVEAYDKTKAVEFDPYRIVTSPKGGIMLKLISRKS